MSWLWSFDFTIHTISLKQYRNFAQIPYDFLREYHANKDSLPKSSDYFYLVSYYLSCPVDEEGSTDDVEERNDQNQGTGGIQN